MTMTLTSAFDRTLRELRVKITGVGLARPVVIIDSAGNEVAFGAGGGGDASAANQATQITAANLTNTTLGAVTASPTAFTIGDRLKTIAANQATMITNQTATGISSQNLQGGQARGVAVSVNPALGGGRGSSVAPTAVTNGQTVDLWLTTSGATVAATAISAGNADGLSNTVGFIQGINSSAYSLSVYPSAYNRATALWDRVSGDAVSLFSKAPPLAGTDRSITATTTSQQLMAANASRTKFYIQNDSAVDVYVNIGATAVASAGGGNKKIAASGGYWEFTGTNSAINIIASATTAAITAREF